MPGTEEAKLAWQELVAAHLQNRQVGHGGFDQQKQPRGQH